jgi:hypothetical protein
MLAAGGALAVLGQAAFSQLVELDRPLLPDIGPVLNIDLEAEAMASGPVTTAASPATNTTAGNATVAVTPVTRVAEAAEPALGAIEPVRTTPSVEELGQADVESLVKAAGLAEAARAAQEAQQRAAAEAAAKAADLPSVRGSQCAPNSAGFGEVKAWVEDAGHWLRCIFGVRTVGGVAKRANASDHPRGLALDFMVDRATGDKLAEYALKYQRELKIKYVIWRQRINYGSGWRAMEDRGSITANHYDHVHISFSA